MGLFESKNKNFESPFTASPAFSEVEFVNLAGLYEMVGDDVVVVRDMWINTKGKYGEHGVLGVQVFVNEQDIVFYNLSLPAHLNDTIKDIRGDEECIKAVNDGKCGIKVRQYHSKTYNKDCFSIEFVDL